MLVSPFGKEWLPGAPYVAGSMSFQTSPAGTSLTVHLQRRFLPGFSMSASVWT